MSPEAPLLSLRDVSLTRADGGAVLRDISFDMAPGEVLAVVGESGSGKSQLLLSLLGLAMPGATLAGSILFRGQQLVGAGEPALRALRGNRIAMLFQDPKTALNPCLTIRAQLQEVLRDRRGLDRAALNSRLVEALRAVDMPDPEQMLRQYPHELSGGMRQRVMLAMAVLVEPDLLLADEPTTALDVTTQAKVLDLMLSLRQRMGMGILLVTHDLGVVARMAGRALVLRHGRIVEQGDTATLLTSPASDYGAELLGAVQRLEQGVKQGLKYGNGAA